MDITCLYNVVVGHCVSTEQIGSNLYNIYYVLDTNISLCENLKM